MKLECNKSKIESAIQKTSKLANKHLTLPISKRMSLKALTVVGDVLKGIPAEKLYKEIGI